MDTRRVQAPHIVGTLRGQQRLETDYMEAREFLDEVRMRKAGGERNSVGGDIPEVGRRSEAGAIAPEEHKGIECFGCWRDVCARWRMQKKDDDS
jgi:hypothetical protein